MSHQAHFTEDYKFVSACVHCGKPMAAISIDRWDREPVPLGQMFKRDVFKVWVDPQHECSYLTISETAPIAAQHRSEEQ
jgi:hypothetical protein